MHVEKKDTELFKTRFLPSTIKSFTQFRGGIILFPFSFLPVFSHTLTLSALNVTMREISLALGCTPLELPASSAGYAEFMDIERQDSKANLSLARRITNSTTGEEDSVDERLNSVSRRLAEELGDDEYSESPTTTYDEASHTGPRHSRVISTAEHSPPAGEDVNSNIDGTVTEVALNRSRPITIPTTPKPFHNHPTRRSPGFCIRSLRRVYDCFASDQHNILVECLVEGNLHGGADDSLRLHDPLPSLRDTYRYRYVPVNEPEKPHSPRVRRRRRTWMESVPPSPVSTPTTTKGEKPGRSEEIFYEMMREKSLSEQKFDETAEASHHSLTRVYSFLFAME